jgi:hypothetical protein
MLQADEDCSDDGMKDAELMAHARSDVRQSVDDVVVPVEN